jgi:Amt family ammonium transporter
MGKNWQLGHGAVDFAGSGVVHSMGGVIALAGAIIIGPRIGKYGPDGKPRAMPGHNIPLAILGTFILAFGWFGFNPGSTLAGTDLRMSAVVVNTMLASVTGALATMWYLMLTGKKPDPSMLLNGMLAGLVAITAPCAFVETWAACLIGAVSGVLVVISVNFWDNAGVDDPVGAISVHGVNGLWGVISLGIFASGKYGAGWNGVVRDEWVKSDIGYDGVRGILYGDAGQLWAQLIDAATVAVFGFVMAWVWFKISDKITPIRVPRDVEIQGLDIPEMGAVGYAGFVLSADE